MWGGWTLTINLFESTNIFNTKLKWNFTVNVSFNVNYEKLMIRNQFSQTTSPTTVLVLVSTMFVVRFMSKSYAMD